MTMRPLCYCTTSVCADWKVPGIREPKKKWRSMDCYTISSNVLLMQLLAGKVACSKEHAVIYRKWQIFFHISLMTFSGLWRKTVTYLLLLSGQGQFHKQSFFLFDLDANFFSNKHLLVFAAQLCKFGWSQLCPGICILCEMWWYTMR